jgi:hypothetical protein
MRFITSFISETLHMTLVMVRKDLPLYALVALYTAIAIAVLFQIHALDMLSHGLYYSQWTTMFLFLMPTVALAGEAIYVIHRFDSRRRLAFRRMYSANRIACLFSGVAILMGLMFFQGSFTSLKNILPLLHDGFPYDQVQADIDRVLHFGIDPWRLTNWVASADALRALIEWNYNVLWFILCFGALFFVATSPRARAMRTRYIIMFMLTWVVCGNIMAGIFLSAGPVFYGAVTGDAERFAELTAFLAGSGNAFSSAAAFQAYLWSLYETRSAGFGSGISAFPSVHVALITMNALFLYDISRRWGLVAFAYTGFIVMSSVYLGWHYAIDGYVSLVVVVTLHQACKRMSHAGDLARFWQKAAVRPATTS